MQNTVGNQHGVTMKRAQRYDAGGHGASARGVPARGQGHLMHSLKIRNSDGGRSHTMTRKRAVVGAATLAVMLLLVVACQPVGIGNPGAKVGNDLDPAKCPGLQASAAPPCGPQPLLWASINGPYNAFINGDPYATHCMPGGSFGVNCTQGNPSYRTTGYAYEIEVPPADVGRVLTLQGYDIGSYPRTVGNGGTSAGPARDIDDLMTTNGSPTVTSATANFKAADVGQRVFPVLGYSSSSLAISSVTDATTAVLSAGAVRTGKTSATIGYDCNTAKAPFDQALYRAMLPGSCQTGDDTDYQGQNIDVQVFANDGSGNPSFATPLAGCHFSHTGLELSSALTTYKNTWANLCTFTPTQKGIYALRFRNRGIDAMADVGQGNNQYALKVLGGSSTRLHALDDQSIFMNDIGTTSSISYLVDVPAANAGKKLMIDLFDVGDGYGSAQFSVQVLAPPGGAPSSSPAATGVVVPTTGVATSCMYNATPSATIGPVTPDVAPACSAVTHIAGAQAGVYDGQWLRFAVTLDPGYACTTDCWWTLKWNWNSAGTPNDRVTYTAKIV